MEQSIRTDFRYQISNNIEELFIAELDYKLNKGISLIQRWLYVYGKDIKRYLIIPHI